MTIIDAHAADKLRAAIDAEKEATIARLTAELAWLKRSIFGSADYHPSLIVGQFAEMAQTANEARKHAIARADRIEALIAERDAARDAALEEAANKVEKDRWPTSGDAYRIADAIRAMKGKSNE